MAPSPHHSLLCIILVLSGSGDVDLVGVEGHWTLIEHPCLNVFKNSGFELGWPRAVSAFRQVLPHQGALQASPSGACGKGPDSLGQSHWASPFFSPGSLCVSGTRRGAPSGGGRLGSSLDFPRLNGFGGRNRTSVSGPLALPRPRPSSWSRLACGCRSQLCPSCDPGLERHKSRHAGLFCNSNTGI